MPSGGTALRPDLGSADGRRHRRRVDVASLLHEAEALRRSGWLGAARDGFMKSAEAAEAAADTEGYVTAALGLGGIWVHEQRDVVARAAVRAIWQQAGDLALARSQERARLAVSAPSIRPMAAP